MNESILQNRELISRIIKLAPDMMIGLDEGGKLIFANDEASKMLGYTVEKLMGMDWFENFIKPENRDEIRKVFTGIYSTKAIEHHNTNIIQTKENGERTISWSNSVLSDGDKFQMILSIGKDVTDEMNYREKLESSEEKFKVIFESAPDPMVLVDPSGHIIDSNKAAEIISGYSLRETRRMSVFKWSLVPSSEIFKLTRLFATLALGRKVEKKKFSIRHKEGAIVSLEINAYPVKIAGKKYYLAITRVLTNTERDELQFTRLFDVYPFGLITGQIIRESDSKSVKDIKLQNINQFAAEILELGDENIPEKSLSELKEKPYYTLLSKILEEYKNSDRLPNQSINIFDSRTNIPYRVNLIPIDFDHVLIRVEKGMEGIENNLVNLLLDSISSPIIVTDLHDKVLDFNEGFTKIIGVKNDVENIEAVAQEAWIRMLKHEEGALKKIYNESKTKLLETKKNVGFVMNIPITGISGGRELSVELSILMDNTGEPMGVVTKFAELQGKATSDQELLKVQHVIEQSPASIVITDTDANITYVNPKFTEVTGFTKAEVLGKNPRILQSGQTPQSVYKGLWENITNNKEWKGELINKKKNGEVFWEFASITAIKDKEGKNINYVAIKEDMSKRKYAEEEQNRMKRVIEAAADFIGMATAEGKVSYLNPAGRRMVGCGIDDDISDMFITDFVAPENVSTITTEAIPIALEEGSWTGEGFLVHKDGHTIPVSLSIQAERDEHGNIRWFTAIIRDMRKQKESELLLKDKLEQLEKVNKLMIGREIKMSELKQQINQIKGGAGDFNFEDNGDVS